MIDTKQMLLALELIKHNIISNEKNGKIANGHYQLKMWKWKLLRFFRISVNVAFYLFITYLIFF
jgi:hypothetical protein